MRKIPPSSTGMRLLDPVRSCSVAGPGKRDRKSAFPLALPLRYSMEYSISVRVWNLFFLLLHGILPITSVSREILPTHN